MKTSNKLLTGGFIFIGAVLALSLATGRHATQQTPIVTNPSAPSIKSEANVKTTANATTVTQELETFNAIQIEGAGNFTIHTGTKPEIKSTAAPELLDRFTIKVTNHILLIHENKNFNQPTPINIHFDITTPQLNEISVGGAAHIVATEIQNDTFTLNVGGAAHCEFTGQTKQFRLNIGGASEVDAEKLVAQNVTITSSGAIHAVIRATQSLVVNGGGIGDIKYYGRPAKIENHLLGLLSLEAGE